MVPLAIHLINGYVVTKSTWSPISTMNISVVTKTKNLVSTIKLDKINMVENFHQENVSNEDDDPYGGPSLPNEGWDFLLLQQHSVDNDLNLILLYL